MDSATIAVIAGFAGVAVTQAAILVRLSLNHRDARKRDAAAVVTQAAALAAAAKLVDERTERDRRWLVEDRASVAAELAATGQRTADRIASDLMRTADTLAAKVAADQAEIARVSREHAAELAAQARHDQHMIALQVKTAEGVASAAVVDLTALVVDVGTKADAAYHEANSINVKIEHLAEAGLVAKVEPWDPRTGDRREPKA